MERGNYGTKEWYYLGPIQKPGYLSFVVIKEFKALLLLFLTPPILLFFEDRVRPYEVDPGSKLRRGRTRGMPTSQRVRYDSRKSHGHELPSIAVLPSTSHATSSHIRVALHVRSHLTSLACG